MLRRACPRFCAAKFSDQYASTKSNMKGDCKDRFRTSIQVSLTRDQPGALLRALEPFDKAGISVDQIQSREIPYESQNKYVSLYFDVPVHAEDPKMKDVMTRLRADHPHVTQLGTWQIPWYPTRIAELDWLDQKTLAAGADLADDPENPHPGFHDEEYRARRKVICDEASKYRYGQDLPYVDYNEAENKTWTTVWDSLTKLYPTHACRQFNATFPLLVESGAFSRERVPQLRDVNEFLMDTTGFCVRPVAGLLSARDFFAALAFRCFYSTQYIRHHSKPLYTPEPDCVHELMGHVPLLADPAFANFSQQFGLLSLGASDEAIEKLGHCYWYSVEFGLCTEGGGNRAYGAGLLSSFGELEYALTDKPKFGAWDPFKASVQDYPITTYQPHYFVAESFEDAQKKLLEFGDTLDSPFRLQYNQSSRSIKTFSKAPEILARNPIR